MELPIPEVELLNADEEIDLARRIEAGLFAAEALTNRRCPVSATHEELQLLVDEGLAAQQHLFLANLRLVAMHARGWAQRSRLPVEDLFQEGCVGLARAVQVWDHSRGVRFGTLAWRLVRNAVLSAVLSRAGLGANTPGRQRAVWATRRELGRLESELGRVVGVHELADHLGKDAELIAEYVHSGGPAELPTDVMAPVAARQIELVLPNWLDRLPKAHRQVLAARYGIGQAPCTLDELAQQMGTSPSSARRAETKALAAARQVLQQVGAA